MRAVRFLSRLVRSFFAVLRNHYLGVMAIAACAAAAHLWLVLAQDSAVTLNVFQGWRQAAIVACAGVAFGGLAAEFVALAGRSVPGETPVGSGIVAVVFAMPLYAGCILLSLATSN